MATMADAVDPANLPPGMAAYAGYIDGPQSKWPADAWTQFGAAPVLTVSVLANPAAMAFDSEPGNASPTAVAVAVAARARGGLPSVVYANGVGLVPMSDALRMKGLPWLPAAAWPHPGPYLWAAAPGTPPGAVPTWCPVRPVAVQDRFLGTYDLSTLAPGWLPVLDVGSAAPGEPALKRTEDDVLYILTAPSGAAYLLYAGKVVGLTDAASVQAFVAAGARIVALPSTADLDAVSKAYA